jgi:hypothetical protein
VLLTPASPPVLQGLTRRVRSLDHLRKGECEGKTPLALFVFDLQGKDDQSFLPGNAPTGRVAAVAGCVMSAPLRGRTNPSPKRCPHDLCRSQDPTSWQIQVEADKRQEGSRRLRGYRRSQGQRLKPSYREPRKRLRSVRTLRCRRVRSNLEPIWAHRG